MPPLDLPLLFEMSKKLHGFLFHDWCGRYLGSVAESLRRLSEQGYLGADWQPSPATDHLLALDVDALDLEKLTDIVGLYFYIYASHKATNRRLAGDPGVRRVLYLRGFEYQTDIGIGPAGKAGLAYTLMTPDSWYFTHNLAERLRGEFGLLATLAPEDVYFARYDAKRYFDRLDYLGVMNMAARSPSAFYLNARHWRHDLAKIADRVDYFVVYLSSLTESSLWEISLLREKGRQSDVTIVFDPDAAQAKQSQADFDTNFARHVSGTVIWPGAAVHDREMTADQWHDRLSSEFHVVPPERFFASLDHIRQRIASASGPACPDERRVPIEFRFEPAADPSDVDKLHKLQRQLMSVTRALAEERSITNLPWYLNVLRVAVLAGLMLGRHDESGRALARYAATVSVLRDRFFPDGRTPADGVTVADPARLLDTLADHSSAAETIGWTLLSLGKSDEFGDYRRLATDSYDEEFGVTRSAVESFMDRCRNSA
ncbi:MAG: hypothetical protein M3422_17790 [Actinomycetota bacterium]|nr:hypothetical protein [Actinomycetota bacterium]